MREKVEKKMKELRVFDKVDGHKYILGVGELIKTIEQIDSNIVNGQWIIQKGAYGYGELICSIEDELENSKQYLIEGSDIFSVLKSGEEYFYHACIKKDSADIEIGIFDSMYLFVRSNSDELINYLENSFREVKITDY